MTNRPRAKKHLGQNFLTSSALITRMLEAYALDENMTILEIGPGRGALTKHLIHSGAQVIAVEKDPDCVAVLQDAFSAAQNLTLIEHDFLSLDLDTLPAPDKIIGNIPYNISSPIIEKLIRSRSLCSESFLTVQYEFARRLIAKPGTKDYSALTCFLQYHADIELLFKVPRTAFHPQPRVNSAFIHIRFRPPALAAHDERLLFRLTRTAFQQRRKKIANALEQLFPKEESHELLEMCRLPAGLRPDQISLDDYVRMTNARCDQIKNR
ncbi:MAG: 16S rRNA (adenine(1518)-N(6)/adenine(1519)-N(6))-dimethyltransferase RsmA [Candidatus Omnitrophota bacterium]